MSVQITTAFVQQFSANVFLLSQQKGSRLRDAVRVDSGVNGEVAYYERIGATAAVVRTSRHGDTPLMETPHSRRRVDLKDYEWADLVDKEDKIRLLISPESEYAQNAGYAIGRAIDDAIIVGIYGTAYSGKDGSTTVVLPAGQKVAQDGTPSSMTVAKLLEAKKLLDAADVDPDEPRYCAISAKALGALLVTTEVKSYDYNTVKALVRGEIDTFMGFKFIMTNRLPLVTTGTYRASYCWAQQGVILAVGAEQKARIDQRADKSYSTQVYVAATFGSTRLEDEKVVEIPCLATD